jgi:predicted ATPase
LVAASYSSDFPPRLGDDGRGLASVIANLKLSHEDHFEQIMEELRRIIPPVRKVRVARKPVRAVLPPANGVNMIPNEQTTIVTGEELVLDFQGATGVPAPMVSQGTLLTLGLLTAILGTFAPQLLLLDDLDHDLHPKAQREFCKFLQRFLEEHPEVQVVATTHSPYLIDVMKPHQVRLTARQDDGSIACAALHEHPKFEQWKEAMLPGEFWSMVGEEWVRKLQPQEAGT